MAAIDRQLLIRAPADVIYRVSQDYAVRYRWDPFPERIERLDGETGDPRIGTRVRVRSKLGMTMDVEFVQAAPPSRARRSR